MPSSSQLNSCPSHIKKMCYLAMVRPILEYSSVVWSSFTNSNIHKVEMVQRRAARFITHNCSPRVSVTEMLKNLNLPSLEERRNSLKLVMMYKILHNFVQVESRAHVIPTQSHTRGLNQRFLQPQSTVDAHLYSFYQSTIKLWNKLPSCAVKSPPSPHLNNQ